MVRCTEAGDRTLPLTRVAEQQSSLGGAEERHADPPGSRLRAFGGLGGGPAAGRDLRGTAALPLARKPYGYTKLFQPSFKLKSSVREGRRIKRQHHPPHTPLQHLRIGVMGDQEAQGLGSSESGVTRWRCWPRWAAARAGLYRKAETASVPSRPRGSLCGSCRSHPPVAKAEADVGSQELLERLIALDPERYGQGAGVPGELSSAAGNQAGEERKRCYQASIKLLIID